MRVNEYGTILDKESRHTILVKEKGFNYNYPDNKFNSPNRIVDMMNSVYGLNEKAEEYLYMLALDTKFHLLGVFEVSHGSVNMSIAGAREIFVRALLCGAANIVLIHNHPSGDVSASEEDAETCKRVKEAGKLLQVPLIDFIIVGGSDYLGCISAGVM